MTNPYMPTKTSPLYNVQPTSHTSKHRIFPSLPYTTEDLKFISKFISNSLTLQIPSTLHFATYYSITKHDMQHIELMLAKVQLPFKTLSLSYLKEIL